MIKILRYKPYDKPPLMGFLDIEIEAWQLEIRGLTVVRNDKGQRWFNLPSKEYTKEDGTTGYAGIVKLTNDDTFKRFVTALSASFDEYCKANQTQEHPEPPVDF